MRMIDGNEKEMLEFMANVGRTATANGREEFENPYKNPYPLLEVVTEDMVLEVLTENMVENAAAAES